MTHPWAACVVGRDDEPMHVGPTREAVIAEALEAEDERRECEGCDDELLPRLDVVVYGGCRWERIPEDEREDDGPSHWLVDWETKELVEADEDEPTDETHFYGVDP